jgi:hypothetical protein
MNRNQKAIIDALFNGSHLEPTELLVASQLIEGFKLNLESRSPNAKSEARRIIEYSVAMYFDSNTKVTDKYILGAGLAQFLESNFGSQKMAEQMNAQGFKREAKKSVAQELAEIESLNKAISKAAQLEANDNHLSDDKRVALVKRYKQTYPDSKLPDDFTEAYVAIIFDEVQYE